MKAVFYGFAMGGGISLGKDFKIMIKFSRDIK